MAHYDFRKDLAKAKEVELEFMELYCKDRTILYSKINDDNKFDILVKTPEKEVTFEVKHDIMSCYTGNLAVEYECRGKPSGIVTSQADYWVYKLDKDFFLIERKTLRKLIDDQKYFRIVSGGDKDSNTKMFLFKLDFMKSQMNKI